MLKKIHFNLLNWKGISSLVAVKTGVSSICVLKEWKEKNIKISADLPCDSEMFH